MTETKTNYTEAQTLQLVQEYKAGTPVEQLAEKMGKSVRSVVAKLSREGVYQPKTRNTGTARVTKAALTTMLEAKLQMPEGSLDSLQKASHDQLEALVARVA